MYSLLAKNGAGLARSAMSLLSRGLAAKCLKCL